MWKRKKETWPDLLEGDEVKVCYKVKKLINGLN